MAMYSLELFLHHHAVLCQSRLLHLDCIQLSIYANLPSALCMHE